MIAPLQSKKTDSACSLKSGKLSLKGIRWNIIWASVDVRVDHNPRQ